MKRPGIDRAARRLRNGALGVLLATGLLTGLALQVTRPTDLDGQDPGVRSYTERAAAAPRPAGFLQTTHPFQAPLPQSPFPNARRYAPTMRYSTYLGGSAVEVSAGVALDGAGYLYTAGATTSSDFPTRDALFAYQGGFLLGADAYVARYSPGGDTLVWATYLGGMSDELVADLIVGDDGAVYVAGGTASPDFPTRNALFSYQGGGVLLTDGFVARLTADGTALDFSTFLGGSGDEGVSALARDAAGNLYLAGGTNSDDFPTTPGAFQTTRADTSAQRMDAFVVKLRPDGPDGYTLDYATYLGGHGDEAPIGLAVDGEGAAWVTGFTNAPDFPTQNALQDTYAGPIRTLEGDVFVARLSPDGTALDFSTFLGGTQDDQGTALALDADGHVYVAGWTESRDFPTTPGAYETERQGIRDAFVMKLTQPAGGAWMLDYATRLAGPGYEMGRTGLAVDAAGRVWVGGATTSEAYPTRDPMQMSYGGGESDAFLTRLDASGAVLGFSTFLGGSGADVVTGLALGADAACVTGSTGSADFPTRGAVQPAFDGPSVAGLQATSAFVACYDVVNEASVLTRLAVSPDSVGLIAGQAQPFAAEGFDQFNQSLAVTPQWSATGGTIDSTGLYTAGDDAGLFTVTATDTGTGLTASALVNLFSGVGTEDEAGIPTEFALYANYPNPFNPQTVIRFDVKARTRVVLTLYDVLGRKQATLVERDYAPGRYAVTFNGRGWPSGLYFYAIEMGEPGSDPGQVFQAVKKMILVR